MQTPDITIVSLFLCSLLLFIPLAISIIFRLRIIRSTLWAVLRMVVQLVLIGIFLRYLFQFNNGILNVAWIFVMIFVATANVINKTQLRFKVFVLPTLASFVIATLFVVLYFTGIVLRLDNIIDARYFVVIGGMLLGNSLRGDIIGIGNFYRAVRRNENRYLYHLACGATTMEALSPYFKESFISALQPTIATMATMGIVFLPGMMTGQILGGVSPLLAIKYQIAIMIAIFVSTTIAINLTILFTVRTCFNEYGIVRKTIFAQKQ
ncbi:MAG: ABC transporter permease [candidate division WOR-3 bacterium]|nr:MAG: ABC transporter permease [candidate division WOR-3 bacterium]